MKIFLVRWESSSEIDQHSVVVARNAKEAEHFFRKKRRDDFTEINFVRKINTGRQAIFDHCTRVSH